MSDCPACGEKVKTGVAVCKHCHAILDAEKAAQHGLGPSAALRQGLAKGSVEQANTSQRSDHYSNQNSNQSKKNGEVK